MIDISTERVVTLTEATRHLPTRRRGSRPHVSTLFRWAQIGVKGIRLETIQVGGARCTSLEAMQRFCDRLTGPDQAPAPVATNRQRRAAIAKAEAELARAGI